MCTICGCEADDISSGKVGGHNQTGSHTLGHSHHDPEYAHGHAHEHEHASGSHDHVTESIDLGTGPAGLEIAGLSQERTIRIGRDILSKNGAFADANRVWLRRAGIFALNLVSSPGSGKTSLLVRTIAELKERFSIAVIEGDQQTSNDADRIRAAGAPAVQINTGKGCHLDAHMVGHALHRLPVTAGGLLFIENVGNLVCPAAFDLGEAHKVVVLSVTEGEDKPLKYPDMFAAADLMLLNKIDLLPHVDFDVNACIEAAQRVNPNIQTMLVSARSGEGLQAFYDWIAAQASTVAKMDECAE